jgi:hypothetical protein
MFYLNYIAIAVYTTECQWRGLSILRCEKSLSSHLTEYEGYYHRAGTRGALVSDLYVITLKFEIPQLAYFNPK